METTQFKDNVKNAAAYLERAGIKVPHTQLLEAISKAFGERNWSTMRALLENPPEPVAAAQDEPQKDWDPAKHGLMPQSQFVQCGGGRCPVCRSKEINSDAPQADGSDAWDETTCEDCRSSWNTDYIITGYSNLQHGSNAPDHREELIDELVEHVRHRAAKYEFALHTEDQAEEAVRNSADALGYEPNDDEIALAVEALLS